MREAEESGQRQREERIRRTEDEIFKQVVQPSQQSLTTTCMSHVGILFILYSLQMIRVHQGTVDSYLEDAILHSIEKTADQQVVPLCMCCWVGVVLCSKHEYPALLVLLATSGG